MLHDQYTPLTQLQFLTVADFSLSCEYCYIIFPLLIPPHQTCLLMNAEFLLSNQIWLHFSGCTTFNFFLTLFLLSFIDISFSSINPSYCISSGISSLLKTVLACIYLWLFPRESTAVLLQILTSSIDILK